MKMERLSLNIPLGKIVMGDRIVTIPRECPSCGSDEVEYTPVWMKNEIKCNCGDCDHVFWR